MGASCMQTQQVRQLTLQLRALLAHLELSLICKCQRRIQQGAIREASLM